ncbi:hypothetical protein MMUR_52840 [Mycolicibacterium murale]|uniref:Uncharacterized protein n=1 Tax=Mycolicibacterium murale TaxID=182220 RepID=A0A7I9WUR4_9MYCO|nr:hypothetical protein MMUR_52840 [Mycolicibacterium murale]
MLSGSDRAPVTTATTPLGNPAGMSSRSVSGTGSKLSDAGSGAKDCGAVGCDRRPAPTFPETPAI